MPLYLDSHHKVPGLTAEAVAGAHAPHRRQSSRRIARPMGSSRTSCRRSKRERSQDLVGRLRVALLASNAERLGSHGGHEPSNAGLVI